MLQYKEKYSIHIHSLSGQGGKGFICFVFYAGSFAIMSIGGFSWHKPVAHE